MRVGGYWTNVGNKRPGRRRLLQGIAAGASGVVVAACGGSDKKEDLTGLFTPRAETTNQGDPFAGVRLH